MPNYSVTARVVRCAALAVLACFAVATPVLGNHQPSRLALTPLGESGQFFNLTLQPGESRDLKVEVANFGRDQLLTRTYVADAYTIINGGFGARLFGEPRSGTTLWLGYPDQQLLLDADAGHVIDFSLSVPADTPPGEYITALVAENVEPFRATDAGGVAVDQVNRTVVAVNVDIPGPRHPALEIGAVGYKAAGGVSYITFEVANPGNVHLKPAGSFILRDAQQQAIATYEPAMDSVYAGTETLLEAPLAAELAAGQYCAELTLTDEATRVGDSTTCMSFTVGAAPLPVDVSIGDGAQRIPVVQPIVDAAGDNPLLAILVVVGGLALAIGLLLVVRRRRRGRLRHA